MIDDALLDTITERLGTNELIHEELPSGGVLHIDKTLPYICIYRFETEEDTYFSGFLKTQASYLIASKALEISVLLEKIARCITLKLKAFLILEFWPLLKEHENTFRIYCPKGKSPATLAALREGFMGFAKIYPGVKVKENTTAMRHPPAMPPLLSLDKSKATGTLIIGIGFPLIFQDESAKEIYSLLYRHLKSHFSEAIKRAVFEFIRVQTTNPFSNYLMLGKTNLNEIILKSDHQLAEISEQMSFLMRVTPVNASDEWERFKESKYVVQPSFNYRLITIDPEQIKKQLYEIPIAHVEDPTIAYIFRDKRLELEKQLIMLEERGTDNFRHIGESLYGKLDDDLIAIAKNILDTYQVDSDRKSSRRLDCHQFAARAREEIRTYEADFRETPFTVEIRKDISGIMVSKAALLVGQDFSMDIRRCDALLQHEIGTHMLTYGNGKKQPLRQMYAGFAGYDKLQEGLAVLSEILVGGLTKNRIRLLAGRVVATRAMLEGADFIEAFRLMGISYGFPKRVAYYIVMRVYRGGGLTKDAMYLSGLLSVLEYLRKNGEIRTLYTGKFNINHVPLIEELLHRNVLQPPALPHFLNREDVKERLQLIRQDMPIADLISL